MYIPNNNPLKNTHTHAMRATIKLLIAFFVVLAITIALIVICISLLKPSLCRAWDLHPTKHIYNKHGRGRHSLQAPSIPKIIWTYWNNDTIPPFIQNCIDSWRKHNPTFHVIVLTPSNLSTYINMDLKGISWNDGPARESDIVRLSILEKYGGVWSDASIILYKPYSFVGKMDGSFDFIGYYLEGFTTNKDYPIIESWFFATPPHGEFISAWKHAFFHLGNNKENTLSIPKRLEQIKPSIDFQKIDNPDYLFIHVAAQHVLQKQMTPADIIKNMWLEKAEDGPYQYLVRNKWNSKASVNYLKDRNRDKDITSAKIRSCERGHISDSILNDLFMSVNA